jgi:large subunit ribosomal protein L15
MIKKPTQAVAILAEGNLNRAYHVKAHRVSKAARAKIEAAGGSIELLPKP